jgi:Spy/CpxP family protein refolding chaperone
MDSNSSKFNWQVRAAVLSVFLLGFVAGALALNAYHVWFGPAAQPTRQQQYQRIFDQLSLSEEQKAEVRKIVGETREEIKALRKESEPRVKEIRAQADERFQKVFTPEQWQKFQNLRDALRESEKTSGK